ncbi:hypothetical protein MK366_08900 [Streptococcus sanguinis]|uniref:hypothetical protein n=1 Tax=Streptococcus sanguinis TaxID=1305 RepID=UPI000F21AE2D|nr:hypothetical protein [Streptococcus sanguinis]MCY7017758.1 hypothetical protein [Streptococcus sanguinis]RKV63918.1 MAG: hypothetical protein D8H99_71155 [Streptococcus sp.]
MNGYQINSNNLNELSKIGNSNQSIGDVDPQGTITTIPLTIILTARLCIPISWIYASVKTGCMR